MGTVSEVLLLRSHTAPSPVEINGGLLALQLFLRFLGEWDDCRWACVVYISCLTDANSRNFHIALSLETYTSLQSLSSQEIFIRA